MEADFSGYATKAGLKCSDGRTIMPDAFKHQDTLTVPLVWQHGHKDPENVLGHAILENRPDGVYCYGFFNGTPRAIQTRSLVEHKDVTRMSIWANDLIERAGRVLHGAIREVSLVLSGANPGAIIDNITIRHSGDEDEILDDEAIIYTGLEFEHSSMDDTKDETEDETKDETKDEIKEDTNDETKGDDVLGHEDEDNVQSVYDSMTDEQKELLHSMVGEALNEEDSESVSHASTNTGEETVQDIYDSMSEKQKQVLHFMIGEAIQSSDSTNLKQDNLDGNDDTKGDEMKHNVFENDKKQNAGSVLSHSEVEGIIADATKSGSLKDAVESYALAHGITDIDTLFPDATALDKVPEFLARRVEWVGAFLGAVRKSPFSRIKTFAADITLEEARAKGYVKGTLKRDEFFAITRRITTPTTIYKKQSLDRDDVVDITDFDIVSWLKSEMRLMLDEEIARAALMGDGRDVSHEDKINEGNIRPISKENELFATTIYVNIADAASSVQEVIDAIIGNRRYYKGTGQPSMYTSESMISKFLLLRDTLGRRIYKSMDEVASELRVSSIIPVEAMEDEGDLVAIIVNPVDYVLGATAGGQVNMFDDFDIDYNKQKYLIETRLSGALTKLKSALVIRSTAGTNVLVVPAMPTFVNATGVLSIVDQTGVVYKNALTNTVINAAGSPYAAIAAGESVSVVATPAAGYYFGSSMDDEWTFTRTV